MAYKKSLADEIKILRAQSNLTQQEVAQRVGVSTRTIIAWESGESIPRMSGKLALAKAFGKDLEYFVRFEERETISPKFTDKLHELMEEEDISTETKSMIVEAVSSILDSR